MTNSRQPQSIFPDYPRERPIVDKTGNLSDLWDLGLSSLFQALQVNFSNEGILFPLLNSDQIATIQSIYTPLIGFPLPQNIPDISGKTIFDETNRIPKQFIITYDSSTPANISTAQWVQLSVLLTSLGNPNGLVGGALNFMCYDITDKSLWICTVAGSANGTPSPQAVWTSI